MPSLTWKLRSPWTAGGLCAVVAVLLAAAPAPAAHEDVDVFPPNSTPFGKTYGEWSAQWWKQAVRQTGEPGTPFAAGRVNCSAMGTRKVVFLVGTTTATGSPVERSCRISTDTAILFPLINGECSEAESNGSTDAELRACAASQADAFTNVYATVDGMALRRLAMFRFASPLYTFSPVAGNVFGIRPAVNSPSVADGYWIMLEELERGRHAVAFGGDAPEFSFTTDTTYRLTVR